MADVGAKCNCLGFSSTRGLYTFQYMEDRLAWLAAENHYRPISIIDASNEELYGAIDRTSVVSLGALRAEMPLNSNPAHP